MKIQLDKIGAELLTSGVYALVFTVAACGHQLREPLHVRNPLALPTGCGRGTCGGYTSVSRLSNQLRRATGRTDLDAGLLRLAQSVDNLPWAPNGPFFTEALDPDVAELCDAIEVVEADRKVYVVLADRLTFARDYLALCLAVAMGANSAPAKAA